MEDGGWRMEDGGWRMEDRKGSAAKGREPQRGSRMGDGGWHRCFWRDEAEAFECAFDLANSMVVLSITTGSITDRQKGCNVAATPK
jgi:hypothetical protein